MIKIPTGFTLGKYKDNGIQLCSINYFAPVEQIFLECKYPNRKECHDTISLLPKIGYSINSITDQKAGEIFESAGWLVKGYNNKKYTRCPHCRTKVNPTLIKQPK